MTHEDSDRRVILSLVASLTAVGLAAVTYVVTSEQLLLAAALFLLVAYASIAHYSISKRWGDGR